MERLKLYRSGQVVGELTAEPEGLYLRFHARCDLCGEGMFRAFAVGQRGEVPLGVLEPKGEGMGLRRTVRTGELQALGTIWRGELRLSYAFAHQTQWQSLAAAGEFFQRDAQLARELSGIPGALWRQERNVRLLALPYRTDQPFPITTLFCFAQIQTIQGQVYVVYRFDRDDHPVFP